MLLDENVWGKGRFSECFVVFWIKILSGGEKMS
jgi:hypothetical protein